MDGEIGLAGLIERRDLPVALQRLQGVAEARRIAAIVDQQGGAALAGDPGADLRAEGLLGGGELEHVAGGGVRQDAIERPRRQAEGEAALIVQPHHALRPAARCPHELTGGQAVEHLVGEQDHRHAGR